MRRLQFAAAMLLACGFGSVAADENLRGFLCCNMYTDGYTVSDISFGGPGQHMIPVGTPIRVTKLKKNKMEVVVENKNIQFGNDYSRDLTINQFAQRYIVAEDPSEKIKSFPKNVQTAIADGHLALGMTREQTLMSLGYPASSEVPNLSAKAWLYWFTDKVQFRVTFDDQDRLSGVENVVDVKSLLLEK